MPDQDEPTTPATPEQPDEQPESQEPAADDWKAGIRETAGMWADRPPDAVSPPTIDPARWEDFSVFRESFLRHFTGPEANAAMRALDALLFEMVLEWNATQPDEPEGYIRHDARAALADLRAVQGFLAYVGSEREDLNEDDPEKADLIRLCKLVGKQAGKVAKIAARIEGALG